MHTRFNASARFAWAIAAALCLTTFRAPAQTPGALSIHPLGGLIVLSWDTTPGKQYQVLSLAGWNDRWRQAAAQPNAIPATTNRLSCAFYPDPASTRFYRVAELIGSAPEGMVWISPGTLRMGSPTNEPGRLENEGPQHEVRIEQGFWMAKFEVTQAEYLGLMGENPSAYHGELTCPVESMTWENAVSYCERLTQNEQNAGRLPTGFVYRLPTEAEWEYACRAGTTTAYSFGNNEYDLETYCWGGHGTDLGHPHPVGQKKPNPWGLYDMHGNVFELCLDWHAAYPEGVIDWPPDTCHTMRGGSFYCPAWVIRSACRNHVLLPNQTSNLAGFRVVLAPTSNP